MPMRSDCAIATSSAFLISGRRRSTSAGIPTATCAGAVDYQRVLLADQTLLQQENNLISLRSGVATNAISLYKALGGGWEMSVGQPFVPDATRIEMQKRTNWGNLFSTLPTTGSPTTSAPPPTAPPPTR